MTSYHPPQLEGSGAVALCLWDCPPDLSEGRRGLRTYTPNTFALPQLSMKFSSFYISTELESSEVSTHFSFLLD